MPCGESTSSSALGSGIGTHPVTQLRCPSLGVQPVFGRAEEHPDTHWRYSPIREIRNARTPTLILFGEKDTCVPPSQGHEHHEALKVLGTETQLVIYPREGHVISKREHQLDLLHRVVDWFDSHLRRSRPSQVTT